MKVKAPLTQKKQPSKSQIQTTSVTHPQKNLQRNTNLQPTAKQNSVQVPTWVSENKNLKDTIIKPKKATFAMTSTQQLPTKLAKQNKVRPTLAQGVTQELFPCKQCGRSFVETSLKRHQQICKKIFTNKRKAFNSAKQRIVSKEQLNLSKISKTNEPKKQIKALMPKWKQQSLAFRMAMKKAKGLPPTAEELNFLAKEKKIMKSTMFKCKNCARTFNQQSGKRHEIHCKLKAKDMANKMKKK